MRRRLIGLIAVLATIALVAVLAQVLYKARHSSAKVACIGELKMIEGAKASWALDNKMGDDAEPQWSDLFGPTKYVRGLPVCPQGGTLTLGMISEYPRCSIPHHSLQQGDVYVFDEFNQPLPGGNRLCAGRGAEPDRVGRTDEDHDRNEWLGPRGIPLGRRDRLCSVQVWLHNEFNPLHHQHHLAGEAGAEEAARIGMRRWLGLQINPAQLTFHAWCRS